jgi:hypothetical protein
LCSENLKWTQIITLSELHTKKNLKNQKSKIVQKQLKREREREGELRQDSICFSATLEAKEKTAYTQR